MLILDRCMWTKRRKETLKNKLVELEEMRFVLPYRERIRNYEYDMLMRYVDRLVTELFRRDY